MLSAFLSAGIEPRILACACYGMTGAIEGAFEIMVPILARAVPTEKVLLLHDTVNAHAGALSGEPGVIVIGGTGSIAYGVNAEGQEARAGGWSYLMGDEGSAYWIGLRALSAITKSSDGRCPATRLLPAILDFMAVADLNALRAKIHYETPERPEIARIAGVVGNLAAEGDAVAQGIMAAAGQELAMAALAVLIRLSMWAEPSPVALVGGVFQAGEVVMEPFRAALHEESPLACIVTPRFPPVVGSLLLALRELGISSTPQVFRQIEDTLSPFREAIQ